jgi:hypothetical protein
MSAGHTLAKSLLVDMSTSSLTFRGLAGSTFLLESCLSLLYPIYVSYSRILAQMRRIIQTNVKVFAVIYGLTGVREMLTKKSENQNVGYVRLPQ